MSDAKFYYRVEREIAHLQDLNKSNTRESLRLLWLTYHSQLKHFKNWEQFAVDKGFARNLRPGEDPKEKGYIVWKEEALHRVLQFDEMAIALDGSDDSIGGREPRIPTARGMEGDGSQAHEKSGTSMTVMFGINFAGEALPPLLIFPTRGKDPKNYKMRVEFALNLPQLKAQYGFSSVRWFNVPFAMNPKGGMNNKMFVKYVKDCILPLYPNVTDDNLNRLILKCDSGPGRNNPEVLLAIRSVGGDLYPGMPNGTEIGQECDQIFGYMKKLTYQNRDKLFASRFKLEGEFAKLSMADISAIVFGGKVTIIHGSEVELVPAFEHAMDSTHIKAAMEKCGYCPSTRAALQAPQVRHQVVEDEDGVIDLDADPYGALLNELEKRMRMHAMLLWDLVTPRLVCLEEK